MLQTLIFREVKSQRVGLSLDSLQSSLSFLRTVLSDFSGAQGVSPVLWAALFVLGLASRGWKQTTLIALWIGAPFAFLAVAVPEHGVASRYVLFTLLCIYSRLHTAWQVLANFLCGLCTVRSVRGSGCSPLSVP